MIELIVRAALAGIIGLVMLINGDNTPQQAHPHAPPQQQHDK
jgi:hypothetical protein